MSAPGCSRGSGGRGIHLASIGNVNRYGEIETEEDSADYEADLARKYPTCESLQEPKKVADTYHDRKIDELMKQSTLNQPLFKSPPVVTVTAPTPAPAPENDRSFYDKAMPIAKALDLGLHQPKLSELGLAPEQCTNLKFGYRVYQCQMAWPGVAYRNSPVFTDKNLNVTGPTDSEIVIADALVQGPHCVYLHCVSGNGWLPLSDPSGKIMCLKHVGPLSKIPFQNYKLADAAKPKPDALKAIMSGSADVSSPGSLKSMDLHANYAFGKRIYQCVVPLDVASGVMYRNSPAFADTNKDIAGPHEGQCIVADAVIQCKNSIVVHCTNGKGWLPLTDATGKRDFMLFKHLGSEASMTKEQLDALNMST